MNRPSPLPFKYSTVISDVDATLVPSESFCSNRELPVLN